MAYSLLYDDEHDNLVSAAAKGVLLGGATLSTLVGLDKLRLAILSRMHKDDKHVLDDIGFVAPKKTASTNGIYGKLLLGAGIPLGAYYAANLYGYLDDRRDLINIKDVSRELMGAVLHPELDPKKVMLDSRLKENKKIAAYILGNEAAIRFVKVAVDESPGWWDKVKNFATGGAGVAGGLAKATWDIAEGTLDTTNALLVQVPKKLPYLYGGLLTIGGLSGYYGAQRYMEGGLDYAGDIPTEAYDLKMKLKKRKRKKAGLFDNFHPIDYIDDKLQISNAWETVTHPVDTLTTVMGLDKNSVHGAFEDLHTVTDFLKKNQHSIRSTIKGVPEIAKAVNNPGKTLLKGVTSKEGLTGLLGAGTLLAAPSMVSNALSGSSSSATSVPTNVKQNIPTTSDYFKRMV